MSQPHPPSAILQQPYSARTPFTNTYKGSANSNPNANARFPPGGTGDVNEDGSPQDEFPPFLPTATNFSNSTAATAATRAPASYFHYNNGGRSRTGRSDSVSRYGPNNDDFEEEDDDDFDFDDSNYVREHPHVVLDKASKILGRDVDEDVNAHPRVNADAGTTIASPAFFSKRTSSLFPPSHGRKESITAPAAGPTTDQAVDYYERPATSLKPPGGHSRSSSIGAISDGFRNLNRWSASTVSSRGSPRPTTRGEASISATQQAPAGKSAFSRRASIDSVALLAQQHASEAAITYQSPRKLIKRRPSEASTSNSPRTRAGSSTRPYSPPPPPAPLPNLPQIIALPSLELPLRADSPASRNRPSPGAGTPSSLFLGLTDGAAAVEPRDYFGDESSDRNSSSAATMRTNAPALLPAASVTRDASVSDRRGHSRNMSSAGKGSADSTKRDRGKQPSQKAMLSKALAKANTAVQLDNAQNYEGARDSYNEACELLQHVLARTNGDDDKKKLEAIVSWPAALPQGINLTRHF
jgi:hypothetical protein